MVEKLPAPDLPDWLEEQLPFERYMIEVSDGLRVHVMEQGEGAPVLLFHGNPTWGYLYRHVAAELVGEPFRLIMPDLIGFGFSDRASHRRDYNLANHTRWMGELVGSLELESATFVVQDWGGPIGLHVAHQHPGLMTSLVVMNTSISSPKPGFKPTLFHRVFSTRLGEWAARWFSLPHAAMHLAQGDRRSIGRSVRRAYTYPLKGPGGHEAVVEAVRMVPHDMDHPSIPFLEEAGRAAESFDGPKAIVWGDKDPVLGKLRRRVTRQLPDAEVTVTDAGHFLQEEVPTEIAAAIRSVTARS
jgi:pimeloyl-ACP methyl ester carboxylesterase